MGRKQSSRGRSPASRRKTAPPQSTPAQARLHELTTKRRGELSELAFTLKAASLGFGVSKPYGDSERYDFILDADDLHSPNVPAFQKPEAKAAKRRNNAAHGASRGKEFNNDQAPAGRNRPIVGAPLLTRSVREKWVSLRPIRESPAVDGPKGRGSHVPPAPTPSRLWRVQVKCSTQLVDGLYRTNAHRRIHGHAVAYLPSEIDFIVAHIIPEDTWYVIPIQAIHGRTSLLFRRQRDPKPGLYDQYREAWPLFRPQK